MLRQKKKSILFLIVKIKKNTMKLLGDKRVRQYILNEKKEEKKTRVENMNRKMFKKSRSQRKKEKYRMVSRRERKVKQNKL